MLEVNLYENSKEISLENAIFMIITYSNNTFNVMQISKDYKTTSVKISANCLKQDLNFAQIKSIQAIISLLQPICSPLTTTRK